MIDQTGRLYFMEPPHPVVYELFDRDLNAPDRSINRVSNSEWCFWAVTADFEVFLCNFIIIQKWVIKSFGSKFFQN